MKTIYVDTSVFGGKFDEEFSIWSTKFFEYVFDSDIKLLISDVAKDELIDAPEKVRYFINTLPKRNLKEVVLTKEAIELAQNYIEEKVVGKSSRADCFHIAIATIQKADLLVSWNFKHIVNLERIQGYNSVNIKYGYQSLEIRNPREAFDYEDDI